MTGTYLVIKYNDTPSIKYDGSHPLDIVKIPSESPRKVRDYNQRMGIEGHDVLKES
jgi:hypothetical protein